MTERYLAELNPACRLIIDEPGLSWRKLMEFQVTDYFDYKDGDLYWKHKGKGRAMDRPVGTKHPLGYTRVSLTIGGKARFYYLHRLVYLYHRGWMPNVVDHIDGDPTNNRIENLRATTQVGNMCNAKAHRDSISGVKGVGWDKRKNLWTARVSLMGRTFQKYFRDLELAQLVIEETREKMHGQYVRHK